ncbi:armadillo repeat-containing protein gudu [Sitodiplosis mosellana]|uniref:armadillo repeat-containing protein gudu n=1 Tax=Sitodiplosis mosellana TaxID=263140 RepID=UPI0024449C43|nr:armadillo repeat-containing protein gudu [Sitodiplosis mosellana]
MFLKKSKSNFSSTKLKKLRKPAPRVAKTQIVATRKAESEESDSSENILSDDENQWKDTKRTVTDPTPDYQNIQKLVKYVKAGNTTATIVSLCCLKDHDLSISTNQMAIQEIGGLEVLVNLLESKDAKCQLGALQVLVRISGSNDVQKAIVDLDGIPLLVNILTEPALNLKTMAAETLANVAKIKLARRLIRKCGGIPKLVDLLDVKLDILLMSREQLADEQKLQVNMACAGAQALCSLSESKPNKETMRKFGLVPLMSRLLKSVHIDLIVPIMGTCQNCASEENFQIAVISENMVENIVYHLYSDNLDIKLQCSLAIFKCASNRTVSDMVREAHGLEQLMSIVKDKSMRDIKPLLAAATGALWKCTLVEENVKQLDNLRILQVFVTLLNDENENVLTNVVGALAECLKFSSNRTSFRTIGGLTQLVSLLNSTYEPLLENVTKALCECAKDIESMHILEQLDAVRLIWSLLKNPCSRVQAYAAWALCPCIKNARNSGELVRSFVGAMELVVGLLKSTDTLVLAATCAAIATIANDKNNLAVLSDHKVIPMLADLVFTSDDMLRENLAAAIANCAPYGTNTQELGRLKIVAPIVGYMVSKNPRVHRTTAMALQRLSVDPQNCITMHQSGVVPFLLETVGSKDKELQEASAGCLQNIRELALRAEEFKLKKVFE